MSPIGYFATVLFWGGITVLVLKHGWATALAVAMVVIGAVAWNKEDL